MADNWLIITTGAFLNCFKHTDISLLSLFKESSIAFLLVMGFDKASQSAVG